MSSEYVSAKKQVNPEFVLNEAKIVFETAAANTLADEIRTDIEAGEPAKALARIDKFRPPQIGSGAVIDVLSDLAGMEDDLKDPTSDIVIKYPGPVGKFFDDMFSRGNFVTFSGPEKGGKSFWLLDVVIMGAMQGRNVFYFQVGDMTRKQIRRRIASRLAGRPFKPGIRKTPKQLDTVGELAVVHDEKKFEKYLSPERAGRALEKFAKYGKTRIKMSVHPTKTLTVSGIKSLIDMEARRGWVTDAVVIDYADILASSAGFQGDSRDAINDIWTNLRSISHGPLVVTATFRSKREAYKGEYITKSDTADDKRKIAHVTAAIGISMKDEEKRLGVCRLNQYALREGEFIESDCCFCAGDLSIARPVILSVPSRKKYDILPYIFFFWILCHQKRGSFIPDLTKNRNFSKTQKYLYKS